MDQAASIKKDIEALRRERSAMENDIKLLKNDIRLLKAAFSQHDESIRRIRSEVTETRSDISRIKR